MSLSISYFMHHPDVPDVGPVRGSVVGEDELDRHAALISPAEARLWLERGAALAAVLRRVLGRA